MSALYRPCFCDHILRYSYNSLTYGSGTKQERTYTASSVLAQNQARVVIAGGGIVGVSVAYHLAKFGLKDVVVFDQGSIGGGPLSVTHSTGFLGQLKRSQFATEICKASMKLYKDFDKERLTTGWKNTGCILLAKHKDRMMNFRRKVAYAKYMDINCHLLSPEDIAKMCSIVKSSDLHGGLFISGDGVGDQYATCITLAKEFQKLGGKIVENCAITKVCVENRTVQSVETSNSTSTKCEYFVNCAGKWASHVGRLTEPRVKIPIYPCEHYYLYSKPIQQLDPELPIIRDLDAHIYLREYEGSRILAGGFEPNAKAVPFDEWIRSKSQLWQLPEDWDHFLVLLENLLHRIPMLNDQMPDKLMNIATCFSPDGNWILGEAPEIQNYIVAAGMGTNSFEAAGGLGEKIARLIIDKEEITDVHCDIRRFLGLHNNNKFLRDRVTEIPAMYYGIEYPFHDFVNGRKLRVSPIYPRLKEAGALFSQTMGYERPAYFRLPTDRISPAEAEENKNSILETKSFWKPHWFDNVQSEYRACRERVALLDYSSFTKIDISGIGVVDFLQKQCSNDVDIPVGFVIHTGMQNPSGGYENDCSLARISKNHFMMIAPTHQQTRCLTYLHKHAPANRSITITDVTSMYTALCIMGAHSPRLLQEATETFFDSETFPFFTMKVLDVGLASDVRVMNLTHTGELGWVLYIPNEFALHVYDWLVDCGQKFNIQHAGHLATRTLRMERFYAFWGQDLDISTTPLECGRSFRVKFDKGDFIGRGALLQQRDHGVKRKYVQLLLDEHDLETDPWPCGKEPIYRDGEIIGLTTTCCYGFTLGKQVCLGYIAKTVENIPQVLTNEYVLTGKYEVQIGASKYPAKISIHSPRLPTVNIEQQKYNTFLATRTEIS